MLVDWLEMCGRLTIYRYSGITEEMMRNVNTTLEQVQQELVDLIDEETVLIGHSLENDLKALKVGSHGEVFRSQPIDPSQTYRGHRRPLPFQPRPAIQAQAIVSRSEAFEPLDPRR